MFFYYVYILRCKDGSYYTGITNNHERRLRQHNEGVNPKSYTFTRRPVELVYVTEFNDVFEAIAWEKQVKGWSRKKKEALIRREFEKLPRLALSKTPTEKLLQKIERLENDKSFFL